MRTSTFGGPLSLLSTAVCFWLTPSPPIGAGIHYCGPQASLEYSLNKIIRLLRGEQRNIKFVKSNSKEALVHCFLHLYVINYLWCNCHVFVSHYHFFTCKSSCKIFFKITNWNLVGILSAWVSAPALSPRHLFLDLFA